MEFKAYTVEDFLSKDEISTILSCAKELTDEQWTTAHQIEFWKSRTCSLHTLKPINRPVMQLLSKEIFPRIRKVLLEQYSPELPIYPDTFDLCRWPVGTSQPPHWDDMKGLGQEKEERNKHRMFGTVLYLNDDYEGGQTYYPKFDHYITPKAGMLAVHPGDEIHEHGVTEIVGTTRYTIASFWHHLPGRTQIYLQDDYFLKTSKTNV